jgi:hypothetical protein
MAFRPCPSLDVKETGGSDDSAIFDANNREWSCFPRVAPGERGINVLDRCGNALRNGAPLVERWVGGCGGNQAIRMAVVKGLETNAAAHERQVFHA